MDNLSSNSDAQWWTKENEDDCASILTRVTDQILMAQSWRRLAYTKFSRLYNAMTSHGFGGAHMPSGPRERLAINVIKNCCDAFVAQLCEEQPKVTFLTSGGDWDLQQKAIDLEMFVDGQFYEMNIYDEERRVILDACITGTGFLNIYIDGTGKNANVRCRRVHPREIIVDDFDGINGNPYCFYWKKMVDRRWLIGFAKSLGVDAEDEINALVGTTNSDDVLPSIYDTTASLVPLMHAWHRATTPTKDPETGDDIPHDGVHVISIRNKVIYRGPWKYDYFPFAIYRRQWAQDGFYGIGLADELFGIQFELNALAQKIQDHHYYASVGHWMVERNSQVTQGHLDNNPKVSIIRYSGTMPQIYFPTGISGDIFTQFNSLYGKAYELTGISQMHAQGEKPQGIDSGKGFATFANIVSKRFSVAVHQRFDLFLKCARQVIDRSREITADDNPKYSVQSVSSMAAVPVQFLKVDLDESEAVLKMHATNKLATDPAVKLGQVNELRAGAPSLIDEYAFLELTGFQDVKAFTDRVQASDDLTHKIVSKILKEGIVIQPRPLMDLGKWMSPGPGAPPEFVPGRAVKIAQMEELRAEVCGAPEERLNLLRQWITTAQNMVPGKPPEPEEIEEGAAPPPPPPDGGMPMPGGPPMDPGAMGPPMPMDPSMGGQMPPMEGPPMPQAAE